MHSRCKDMICSICKICVIILHLCSLPCKAGTLHPCRLSCKLHLVKHPCKIYLDCRYENITWSYPRWKEESGHKYRAEKTSEWMQAEPDLQDVLEQMPSAKTSSTAAYEQHLQYRLQHLQLCVDHFCNKRNRALRWDTFRKRQAALASMCNMITAYSKDAMVGYGDGRFSSQGPTQSLRRRLRSLCHVYDVDEFRTSKLCSACHHSMTGMPSGPQGGASFLFCLRHYNLIQLAAGPH